MRQTLGRLDMGSSELYVRICGYMVPVKTGRERITTRTRTTRYVTLLSVVLALALTVALAACGSDEPSGVTGPDRTASTPTETPVSPAQTPTPTGSGDAPTVKDAKAQGFTAVGHLTPFLDEERDVPYFKTHVDNIATPSRRSARTETRLATTSTSASRSIDGLPRIHRRTPMDGVRKAEGG